MIQVWVYGMPCFYFNALIKFACLYKKRIHFNKQQVLKLNSLRTEKTFMLIKINELEERLLETQLQLERVLDENLTHSCSTCFYYHPYLIPAEVPQDNSRGNIRIEKKNCSKTTCTILEDDKVK